MMRRSLLSAGLLWTATLLGVALAAAQADSGRSPERAVKTGDTLEGTKYFLKLVPVDTTGTTAMPAYRPDGVVAVDEPPRVLRQVQPEFRDTAGAQAPATGTVWVKCLVGVDGTVSKTEALNADTRELVPPARGAAARWLFSPAKVHGKPTPIWVTIPIRFTAK